MSKVLFYHIFPLQVMIFWQFTMEIPYLTTKLIKSLATLYQTPTMFCRLTVNFFWFLKAMNPKQDLVSAYNMKQVSYCQIVCTKYLSCIQLISSYHILLLSIFWFCYSFSVSYKNDYPHDYNDCYNNDYYGKDDN